MLQPVEQRVQIAVVLREEPDPLLVQEVLVEQGPDRAEVDDVAGQRVVDRLAGEDVDLGVIAAPHHLELAGLGDLAGEPDAPRAHDAAVLVELDQVRDVLARVDGRSSTKRWTDWP